MHLNYTVANNVFLPPESNCIQSLLPRTNPNKRHCTQKQCTSDVKSLQLKKDSDLFFSVEFSSNEILIPSLWPQARLANTQYLNLIKPFTVCKAANDMLGKQSRCICILISLQHALCDIYNRSVATAAKLFQVNRAYKFTEIRTAHTSSKFSLLLGKY